MFFPLAFAESPEPLTVVVVGEKSAEEAHQELAVKLEYMGYTRKGIDAKGREVWKVSGSRPTVLLKDGLVVLHDHTVQYTGLGIQVLSPRQVNRLASQVMDEIKLGGIKDVAIGATAAGGE